ncbi:hypothetical protein [Vibrio crassostreae]|uniref:hypothetical protein n=1 Tax=Vibrio crassostreae TaxID=246167 RepID=UPI001B315558|nr:hypothetical protein [Vibrio crassostreae]
MDTPHPIYPSQTDSLKHRSEEFAEHIAKETNAKTLSAFKRNDWVSQALGYKGHTDLLKSTEFRKQADQNQPLALFSDNGLRLKIVDVFEQRTDISYEVLSLCSKQVSEHEAIINNMNPHARLPMYLDEAGFYETPKMTLIREDVNSTLTPKLSTPRLVVDLSELPHNAYEAICAHPAYRGFNFDETRTDVEIIRKQPSSLRATDDWKIITSFDIWSDADIPMDVLNDWVVFKEWLLQFNATGRVHVWDRLKGHTKLQYKLQVSPEFKMTNLYKEMSSEHDTNLLYVLLNHQQKLVKPLIDEQVIFDPKADASFLRYSKQVIEQFAQSNRTFAQSNRTFAQSNRTFDNPLPDLFTDQEALTLKNVFEEKNGIVIFSGFVGSSKYTVAKQVIESNLIPLTRKSNDQIEHGLSMFMLMENSGYIFTGELVDEEQISKLVELSQESLCIGIVHAINMNDALNEMVRLGLTVEQRKQVKAIVHCERKETKTQIQLITTPYDPFFIRSKRTVTDFGPIR